MLISDFQFLVDLLIMWRQKSKNLSIGKITTILHCEKKVFLGKMIDIICVITSAGIFHIEKSLKIATCDAVLKNKKLCLKFFKTASCIAVFSNL